MVVSYGAGLIGAWNFTVVRLRFVNRNGGNREKSGGNAASAEW